MYAKGRMCVWVCLGCALFLVAPLRVPAAQALQPVEFLGDLNAQETGGVTPSSPSKLIVVNGRLYFVAVDGVNGNCLWTSDGTNSGTRLLKENTSPTYVMDVNGTFFYFDFDTAMGDRLWKTDGTAEGTILFPDVGAHASVLKIGATRVAMDGVLYFRGWGGQYDRYTGNGYGGALWRSDGTLAGTYALRAWNVSNESDEAVEGLFAFNHRIYFVHSGAWWTSDGTNVSMADAAALPPVGIPFVAEDRFYVYGDGALWRSDGTAAGTVSLGDFWVCEFGTQLNGQLLFWADDGLGAGLWRSDGTAGGTVKVKDVYSPMAAFTAGSTLFRLSDSTVLFEGTQVDGAYGLWRSDGTENGTGLVSPFASAVVMEGAQVSNGVLYFSARNESSGAELWRSDGTASGTYMVKDIYPGANDGFTGGMAVMNGLLFFAADDGEQGMELWRSDGTEAGTLMAADLNQAAATKDSSPAVLGTAPGAVWLSVDDGLNARKLWIAHPGEGSLAPLKDVTPAYTADYEATWSVAVGNLLYFWADVPEHWTIWRSDGTSEGTVAVASHASAKGDVPSNYMGLVPMNASLYYADSSGIYRNDCAGSASQVIYSGKVLREDIRACGNWLYFGGLEGGQNYELWRSNGSAQGTALFAEINPGSMYSAPRVFTTVGNTIYFEAGEASHGFEPWQVAPGASVPSLVADVYPGYMGSRSWHYTAGGGSLFFVADDSTHGFELWRSDPGRGTYLVKDVRTGSASSNPDNLTWVNGTLFFTATDGAHGIELWKTDGSEAGTVLVKDIVPGPACSSPYGLTAGARCVYFAADDGAHGTELWRSDGSEQGTVMLGDINPGLPGSFPMEITYCSGALYFSAWDREHGRELWEYCSDCDGDSDFEFLSYPHGGWYEAGTSLVLTVVTRGGFGELAYQWVRDGVDIPNATEAEFTIENISETASGTYWCRVTDGHGAVHESPHFEVTVVPEGMLPVSGTLGLVVLAACGLLSGAHACRKQGRRATRS